MNSSLLLVHTENALFQLRSMLIMFLEKKNLARVWISSKKCMIYIFTRSSFISEFFLYIFFPVIYHHRKFLNSQLLPGGFKKKKYCISKFRSLLKNTLIASFSLGEWDF